MTTLNKITATVQPDTPASSSRHQFRDSLLVFIFSFAILAIVYLVRVNTRPDLIVEYNTGDPSMYDWLARTVAGGRGFADIMFGLRPPAPVLWIAWFYALVDYYPTLVVVYVMVLGALSVTLMYKLVLLLTGKRSIALVTAVLLALEVAHIDTHIMLYSEPMHNFAVLCGLYWILRFFKRESWGAVIGAGFCLGVAMLSRVIASNFAILLTLLILFYRRPFRYWKQAVAFFIVCLTFYLGWSYRNYYYVDNFSLSSTGAFTVLFYKSVSVEYHATGRDPHDIAVDVKLELEERLGNTDIDIEEIRRYPVGRDEDLYLNDPERQAVSRQMAIERLLRHPAWTVIMTGVYFVRPFGANADLMLPVTIQIGLTGLMLLLAGVGYLQAWRHWREQRLFMLITHLVIGYYAGIVALAVAGLWAVRYRTPYMPFVLMFSAIGLLWIIRQVRTSKPGSEIL